MSSLWNLKILQPILKTKSYQTERRHKSIKDSKNLVKTNEFMPILNMNYTVELLK